MKKFMSFKVFIIMFSVITITLAFSINYVNAKPPGIKGDEEAGKMLEKFNVILLPENSNWSDSNASCNGARIFFQEDNDSNMGKIEWDFNVGQQQDFLIDDCDGTDGLAVIDVSAEYEILVYVRVHGRAGSYIDLKCENVMEDPDEPGNDLCLIDTERIAKNSRSFTKVMNNLAEDQYEEVLWTWSGDWKIFEVRIYEWLRQ